MSLILFQGGA